MIKIINKKPEKPDKEMKDLFGNEVLDKEPQRKLTGKYEIYRARHHYREGTKEKCCKTCNHCQRWLPYHGDNQYYKCELQGHSNSTNSDIRLKMVCNNWELDK
jgi:hypothetical protein